MHFRKLLFPLALVALLIPLSTTSAKEHSLKAGMSALQFEIDKNFDLVSFQGSTVSFKKQTSDKAAWRAGISFSLDINETDSQLSDDDTLSSYANRDTDRKSITLRIQRVFYSVPKSDVSVFYGMGPMASYDRLRTEETGENLSGYKSVREAVNRTSELGLTGLVGVEWFALTSVSVLAEYESTLTYIHRRNTDERTSETSEEEQSTRVSEYVTDGVSFRSN